MIIKTGWTPDPALGVDFSRRFLIAEQLKMDMRHKYATAVAQSGRRESRDKFLSRSQAHWQEYEAINRKWIPEDPSYNINSQGAVLVVGNDIITYTVAATSIARILECYVGGEASASTVIRVFASPSTGGATPAGTTSFQQLNTLSPTIRGTIATQQGSTAAWTTQPTITNTAKAFFVLAFNAFGGFDRWVPQPGIEAYITTVQSQVSLRPLSGTPTVSAYIVVEEM